MTRNTGRKFLSLPPLRRVLCLLALGVVLAIGAHMYRLSRRPAELPPELAEEGIAMAREVVRLVDESPFGRTERGRILTQHARDLIDRGRLRFSDELGGEALYRKELGCRPILYIGVIQSRTRVLWPEPASLAECIFHETLHAVVNSRKRCLEEECDAFCAAEEAAAAVEGRPPVYPVPRDNEPIWQWVRAAYRRTPSNPDYTPIGHTREELAKKTGIVYGP